MSPTLFRLVLFVSFAHALVHIYELAFPSVEQLVDGEFAAGKDVMGRLGTTFRLPFGVCALLVGWLVDRWSAKRMLVIYLLGCAVTAATIAFIPSLSGLYLALFLLGVFASIYHPAGLALISHETSLANRTRALGTHGIFGSIGIGGAPFLAAMVLSYGSWRDYYLALFLPGMLLGLWFLFRLKESPPLPAPSPLKPGEQPHAEDIPRWGSFTLLTLFGAITGFVYAGFITFLPRYLDTAGIHLGAIPPEAVRNYLSGGVLALGVIGQYAAGRFARPGKLEPLLSGVMLANAPLLGWMAIAQGPMRAWSAGMFAVVHFMNQPIYNSLIASYVPRRRRSLGFGFSFLMSFGVGSFGSAFAGISTSDTFTYGTLGILTIISSLIAAELYRRNRRWPYDAGAPGPKH